MAGLKPEPPLCREGLVLHADVGDQEAVLKHTALKAQPHHLAQGGAGTITADHPIGLQLVRSLGREHLKCHAIGQLLYGLHAVFAPQRDRCTCGLRRPDTIDDKALKLGLLQVDEGGKLMPIFWQKIEFVHFSVFVEHFAKVPDHPTRDHWPSAAKPVCNLEGAFGKTQRPTALPRPLMVIQQHNGHILQAQIQRTGQPDRAASHDHHRVPNGRGSILIRAAGVGIKPVFQGVTIIKHRAFPPNSAPRLAHARIPERSHLVVAGLLRLVTACRALDHGDEPDAETRAAAIAPGPLTSCHRAVLWARALPASAPSIHRKNRSRPDLASPEDLRVRPCLQHQCVRRHSAPARLAGPRPDNRDQPRRCGLAAGAAYRKNLGVGSAEQYLTRHRQHRTASRSPKHCCAPFV